MNATSAIHELPENLPPGEHVLWQGSPGWWALARSLRIGTVSVYFGLMLGWYGVSKASAGMSLPAAFDIARMGGLAAIVIALFALHAWLVSRTTSYTITTRRVVMHLGIAFPISFNVPFNLIAAAGLRAGQGGHGNLSLQLVAGEKLGYFVLWPHARPWRLARTEPMLRAVPDAARVARILGHALAASTERSIVVAEPRPSLAASPALGISVAA